MGSSPSFGGIFRKINFQIMALYSHAYTAAKHSEFQKSTHFTTVNNSFATVENAPFDNTSKQTAMKSTHKKYI